MKFYRCFPNISIDIYRRLNIYRGLLRDEFKCICKFEVIYNKKVLLRERKRHTTCRVVTTPSVVLTGCPPPRLGITPPLGWTWQGTPPPVSAPWHSGKCCKALWDMGTPPRGQTDGRTDACQNITFPSYYIRGR